MAPSKHSSLPGIGICATNNQRHSGGAKATGTVCLPAPLYLQPTVLEIERSSTTTTTKATTNTPASLKTGASTWKGCTGISGFCSTPSPMSLENAQNNTDDHFAGSAEGSCCCCCLDPTAAPGSPTITHTAMTDTSVPLQASAHPRLPKCTCRRAAAALATVANETKTDAGQAHHNSNNSGSGHTSTGTAATVAGSPAAPPTCGNTTNAQTSHNSNNTTTTTTTTTTTLTSSNHKQTTTVSVSLLVQEGSPHAHHLHHLHHHQQQHQQHQHKHQHKHHRDCPVGNAVPVGHYSGSDAASSPSSSLLSPSPPSPSMAHRAQLFHTQHQHSTSDGTATETDDDDSDDSDDSDEEDDSESTTESDSDDDTFGDEDEDCSLGDFDGSVVDANGDNHDEDDHVFALLMQPRLLIHVQGPDVGGGGAAARCHSAPVQFTLAAPTQTRAAAAATSSSPSTECQSRSEECRPPRTRVVRFSDAVVTVMEKQFSAELQRERSAGSLWLQLARDRLRFRRRAAEVSDLFAAARPRGTAYREELAARTIQAAWRRYQCHCLGALRWINRQQSVEAPVLVRRPTLPLDTQVFAVRRPQSAAAPVAVPSSSATLPSSTATAGVTRNAAASASAGGSSASLPSSTAAAVCPLTTALSAQHTAAVCISLGVQGCRGPTVVESPQDWLCQGKGKHRRKGGRHASTSHRTPNTWADSADDAMVDPEDE